MAKLVYFKNYDRYAIQKGFLFKKYLRLGGDSWYDSDESGFRDRCLGSQVDCEASFREYKKRQCTTPIVIKKLEYE